MYKSSIRAKLFVMPSVSWKDSILLLLAAIASVIYLYGEFLWCGYLLISNLFKLSRLAIAITDIFCSLLSFLIMFPLGFFLVGQVYYCWLLFLCFYLIVYMTPMLVFPPPLDWDLFISMLLPNIWSFLMFSLPFMYLGRATKNYVVARLKTN